MARLAAAAAAAAVLVTVWGGTALAEDGSTPPTSTTTTSSTTTTTSATASGTTTTTTASPGGSSAPPAGRADRDCRDFASQQDAQTYFTSIGGSAAVNADRLDANHNGRACEDYRYGAASQVATVPVGGIDTGDGSFAP